MNQSDFNPCQIVNTPSKIMTTPWRLAFRLLKTSLFRVQLPTACPDEHLATAQWTSLDRYPWRITDQRSMLTMRRLDRRFAPPGSISGEKQIGYDLNDNSINIERPTGIGNPACAAVLEYRHHDKSNRNGANWFILPAF
jgi:hypothetical protein